jgi:hypothetical protein
MPLNWTEGAADGQRLPGPRTRLWLARLPVYQLICTDHDYVYYAEIVLASRLAVDTRNPAGDLFEGREIIVKA